MNKDQFLADKIRELVSAGYSKAQASAIAYGQLNKLNYAQQGPQEEHMYSDELKENGYATEVVPNQSDYSEITEDDTVGDLEYTPQKEVWQIWQEKTGLPWKEAKRLGYTDGSAKDNMKLLQEISSENFNPDKLRKTPVGGGGGTRQGRSTSPTPNTPSSIPVRSTPQQKEDNSIYREDQYQNEEESVNAFKQAVKYSKNKGYNGGEQVREFKETSPLRKIAEVGANPFQAFGHYAKYGDAPGQGFSKYNQNSYDSTLGVINPLSWVNSGANALDLFEGGDIEGGLIEAIGALPAAGRLKALKNFELAYKLPTGSLSKYANDLKKLASKLPNIKQGISKLGERVPKLDLKNRINSLKQLPPETTVRIPNIPQKKIRGSGGSPKYFQQGGNFLDSLKGKRIVDYTYNKKTGNYDISYED